MKRVLAVFNNITTSMIVIVLITAILWVMLKQRQVIPLTAQTTLTPSPTVIEHKPTAQNTPTFTAKSAVATSTAPFIFVTPYSLGTPVPTSQPTQTPTSAPVPAVQVISKEAIPLHNILSQHQDDIEGINIFTVRGWMSDKSIILQHNYFTSSGKADVNQMWSITPTGEKIQLLNNPMLLQETTWTTEQQDFVDELKIQAEQQENYRICSLLPSPDGLHIAVGIYEGLDNSYAMIYGINQTEPVTLLANDLSIELNCSTGGLAWSPDGNYLAYSFKTNGIYYLRITDLSGNDLADVELSGSDFPTKISWSPNNFYLALALPVQRQHFPDIFVMKTDGSGLVNVTQDELNDDYLYWNPDSTSIAYNRYDETSGSTLPYLIQFTKQ